MIQKALLAILVVWGSLMLMLSPAIHRGISGGAIDQTQNPDVSSNIAQSVGRQWNEALLDAIRISTPRPTVHARNLFHTSVALYDAWAAYDDSASTYLLGQNVSGFECPFDSVSAASSPITLKADREEAMSYAAYRLLNHRFENSPNADRVHASFDRLMNRLGYNPSYESANYANGSPAALGNYLADCLIEFGLQDGANEQNNYASYAYKPYNSDPLIPVLTGNPNIHDLNRWQPLALQVSYDENGNVISGEPRKFLSPEWGSVAPFALSNEDRAIYVRNDYEYWVYHDPGAPPLLGISSLLEYQWGFALVSVWSSQLDPNDGVMWDISPATLGNYVDDVHNWTQYRDVYDLHEGGYRARGYEINPKTGEPYEPQLVPRGDYTRAIAEFWADGPTSETPPGHWFTILNYVHDHPEFERRFAGQGEIIDDLEWDVKAYLTLGGAVHDAAVTAWGIKGWYDYIRPISAIRGMGDRGQCTDPNLPNFSLDGLPLMDGYIEMVEPGDPLAGPNGENINKVKVKAWRGPSYIEDPDTDYAGVDWILSENWWPYQRPTFITPPFGGYISGHSAFSRASAEVLTLLTGDPFFPGGLGEYSFTKNEYLVFEEGPSVDMKLQWATYRDASVQTSLSRIWGGIHPPQDDMPGRIIGQKIGADAFEHARALFEGR